MRQQTYTLTHEQIVKVYRLWVTDLVENLGDFISHNPDDAESYAEAFLYYLEQV